MNRNDRNSLSGVCVRDIEFGKQTSKKKSKLKMKNKRITTTVNCEEDEEKFVKLLIHFPLRTFLIKKNQNENHSHSILIQFDALE